MMPLINCDSRLPAILQYSALGPGEYMYLNFSFLMTIFYFQLNFILLDYDSIVYGKKIPVILGNHGSFTWLGTWSLSAP